MRRLLTVTTAIEVPTGVLSLLQPSVVLALLFGWREIGSETLLMARVAGAAVLGLGVASWLARDDGHTQARRGLLTGLFIYNAVAVVLLVFAGAVLQTAGLLLWPAVLYHVALTAWSVDCLRPRPERGRR